MNGAESLLHSLVASGVEVCFANPGTSEMHFVSALDRASGMRPVLGLFEGVVSGMADGYARIAGEPAATLLHLGSGLGNAIANLHNARRARSPVVNIVGDHASFHQRWDTPLRSDIAGLARPVSDWLHVSQGAQMVAGDVARAVAAAREPPGQVATLILPADAAWDRADGVAPPLAPRAPSPVAAAAVGRVVEILTARGPSSVILVRGAALGRQGLAALGRVAAASGARLMHDTFAPRIERGAGLPRVQKLPYREEDIVAAFRSVSDVILVGAQPPVTAFAYPGRSGWCLPDDTLITYLAHEHEDGVEAVEALAEALGATSGGDLAPLVTPPAPTGVLDQFSIARTIARHLPDGAIVSEEAATNAAGPYAALGEARPHVYMVNTGGAIGQGIPLATGAAVAAPERKVVSLQADGSALYTVQALWTQAREHLDVVTVIFSNRRYAILEAELQRVGAPPPGERAQALLSLDRPTLGWLELARGFGVAACQVRTAEEFEACFADAMAQRGPRLIEAIV